MLNKHLRIISCILGLALVGAMPAFASPKDELEQTRKEMDASKAKQEQIAEQKDKLQNELGTLQEKLVKAAAEVQKGESDLSDSEEKLRILNEQLTEKNEALKKRQKHLAALVMAALSLSHTPPEAMVMMPGDVTETIKAARALKITSESIRQETQSIGLQMAELQKLKVKVSANHELLVKKQADLDRERKALVSRIAERSALQEKLGMQEKREADKLARLAKKADDLQDLITSVEKELTEQHKLEPKAKEPQKEEKEAEEEEATPATPEKPSGGESGNTRSFAHAKGHIRTPVSGKMVQEFGVTQGRNATSKGIMIAARGQAQVTAPYDGEVVFTGPFLNYGKMVIIRHSDDFHTLLAGLSKIDVGVGQFLLEGEPIGAMGDSESGNSLYIELRKDNQPIDPVQWISGLHQKN